MLPSKRHSAKAEFEQFQRKSEAAIRAASVVEVLLGRNKLKSDLLRSIALKLADVSEDWLASEANRGQIIERALTELEQKLEGAER